MTGKQLKNSILQEAIRGRLTEREPGDEPAAALLARIRSEKERLIKAKKIKRDKNATEIYRNAADGKYWERTLATGAERCIQDEIPFVIPEGWEWCRIKHICFMQAGKNISASEIHSASCAENPYPCIGGNGIRGYTNRFNTSGTYAIVGRQGALCGCLNIAEGDFYATEHAVVVDTYGILSHKFMFYFLWALNLNQYSTATAQPGLAVSNIAEVFFPLPPLSEQGRIVGRVEELLGEAERYGRKREELERLDSEIGGKLRKSILQEAIRGRLTEREPGDEPAAELLARIRAEKERLIKAKKIKRDKNATEIYRNPADGKYWERTLATGAERCIQDEVPFEIPEGWEWCRLGDCLSNRAGLSYAKEDLDRKSDCMVRVLRGGNISFGHWHTEPNDIMISKEFVNDELLLKKGTFITPAVTSLDNMGKTALVAEDLGDTVVGGFVLMLQSYLIEDIFLKYLLYVFGSVYYKEYCKTITNKSGQAFYNISRSKLMRFLLPLPPLPEQGRIVGRVEELLGEAERLGSPGAEVMSRLRRGEESPVAR